MFEIVLNFYLNGKRQSLLKISNIKFNEIPVRMSRVVSYEELIIIIIIIIIIIS